jgi:hypothetical protein
MGDREGTALVVVVFLIGVVERLEEGFLLVRVVLVGLGLGQVLDFAIGHGGLRYGMFRWEIRARPKFRLGGVHT